ncbi:MAG: PAS domain S-box protein [Bacteroidales bacterium]|nr:PAS domain S-box protein [Bacteroidales bacterium]
MNREISNTGLKRRIRELEKENLLLKADQEIYSKLAEYTKEAYILIDQDRVIYANPAFEKIYGRKLQQLYDNPLIIEECIHPEDRKKFLQNRNKELHANKQNGGFYYRLQNLNGRISHVRIRHFPLYRRGGKVYRYIAITSDITTVKDLESTLSVLQNQNRAILDNIPFLAWLKDNTGHYITVNHTFAESYNLKPEDIIGKTDFELCSEEKANEYFKSDQKVILSKRRLFFKQVENLPEGTVWYDTFKTPVFDHDGHVVGIAGISRDITGHALMEKTLQEQEKNFRELLQSSSDAISIIDTRGIIVFESSPKNKISDFDSDELLDKPIFDTVHPDDVESFRLTFEEVLQSPNHQIKKEYRSLHKNRRWVYVESIFSNQLNNPTINGIIVNSRDISDRKMAELKERVYHDNLIFLSNSALELLTLSSKDQIYKYIPRKLTIFLEDAIVVFALYDQQERTIKIESFAGLHPYEEHLKKFLGSGIAGLSFPVDRDALLDNAGQIVTYTDELIKEIFTRLDYGKFQSIKELLQIHKIYNIALARDNTIFGNITILTLHKNIIRFKHIIETFVHQVTVALQRSQLEYELITAKNRAEESDKLKTAFLANMSHEIRTPMNGILGFAEMLNDSRLSATNRKKYLEIINSNGKMLINLIDDIIDFAKIESGQVNIVQDDFSLNNLLKQVRSTFLSGRMKKTKSKVAIRIRKPFQDDKSFIRTDPVRLRQILTNLVGNAIKFTHEGFIEFGYNLTSQNFLQFYVKDSGIGISPEKLELIFERFIQADNSPSRKYGGSGLGLAISKGLTELLGGKMWAESTVKSGSTFYFTIPFVPVEKKPEEKVDKKEPRARYSWEGKLFLIAEDDKFSYKFLEGFLKQTKADVIRAADGREAVELCRSNKNIDLILMDIQMPEMNGLVATREIKKFNPGVPVIAQTANAISEERHRCFEAGCDDFITKPVNISELYTKIDRWLSRKPFEAQR